MAKQFGIRSGTARDARDAPAKGVERAPSYPAEPLESRGTGVERWALAASPPSALSFW